ncbi:ABC transporter permease [Natrinema sp. SYSU A 869]|uniref:ABC transporter permease n=1 Tax=Natrinema sp. SYSU A 869 TaxID=2871694 RepID=UPI001CA3D20D|nr:ABC transporter permease [Natrinema sp. SYSU A 869]
MNYYVKRVIRSFVTLVLVITITFGLTRLMPGGPVDYMRAKLRKQNPNMPSEQIDQMVQAYVGVKPDEPIYVQYLNYVTSVLQGDLGESTYYNEPVVQIYAEAIPWTLFVLGTAMLVTFAISISLGALLAYKEGSRLDSVVSTVAIVMNSVPYYVAAIILIAIFVTNLGMYPLSGRTSLGVTPGFNLPFIVDVLRHATLPMLSVIITGFGVQTLAMRSNSIRVLGEDYIRVARLRMLPTSRIANQYVARNALLPIYTGFVIQIGFIFGGSIILEDIFQYPGVGYYFFNAITARDYPLMMGGFLIISVAVVIAVTIADLTYGLIDPRAGAGGDSSEAY